MTESDFLDALERRAIAALRRAIGPKSWISGDGFVIDGLPATHKSAVTGVAWTLGGRAHRYDLEIQLTPKAHEAWRHGLFETLLPESDADEANWFDYDSSDNIIRLRLKKSGAKKQHKSDALTRSAP